MRSVVPQPIWLVLVLDQSEVSKTCMLLGQRVARLLVASLSEKDRVALVLASDTARVATAGASQLHLLPASHETKLVSLFLYFSFTLNYNENIALFRLDLTFISLVKIQ